MSQSKERTRNQDEARANEGDENGGRWGGGGRFTSFWGKKVFVNQELRVKVNGTANFLYCTHFSVFKPHTMKMG